MQHRATLHAMTPQRFQDFWEDEQTSEAGQDDSEEKYAPMTEAHAMGKTSLLPSLSGRWAWDPTMCDRQLPAPGGPCGMRVASREVSLEAHPH